MIVADTPGAVAETLIISLIPVDYLWDKGLKGVKQLQWSPVEILLKGVCRFVVCNPYPVRAVDRTPYRLG